MKNIEKYWNEAANCIHVKELCKFAVLHDLVDTENGEFTCIDKKECSQCILDTIAWLNQEYKEEIPEGTLVWVSDGLLLSGVMPHINIRRYHGYKDGIHWCYDLRDSENWFPWRYVEIVKEGILSQESTL